MLLLQWSKNFLQQIYLLRCQNKKMGPNVSFILIFWTNQKPREFLRHLINFCCLGCRLWSQVFRHHHPNWIIRYNDVKCKGKWFYNAHCTFTIYCKPPRPGTGVLGERVRAVIFDEAAESSIRVAGEAVRTTKQHVGKAGFSRSWRGQFY